MLTSNLLGLLAGLTIFASQGFASPILARQDAAEGVVIGHDIQATEHTTIPVRPTGITLAKRTGISRPDSASSPAITAAPKIVKRAEVGEKEYRSVLESLLTAYINSITPKAIVGSSMDSYKANNVVAGPTGSSFKVSVDSSQASWTSKWKTECGACDAMNEGATTTGVYPPVTTT